MPIPVCRHAMILAPAAAFALVMQVCLRHLGDTVNTAARMQQASEAGRMNISGVTYKLVKNNYTCAHRGKIEAKNKGAIDMYFVEATAVTA